MATIPEAIVTVLSADSTLMALLTGGVYSWDVVGRNGINATDAPNAYDADAYLKPVGIVRQRTETPWGGGADHAQQWRTMRTMIEVYLYADGSNGFSVLQAPMLRALKLLDEQFVANAGWLKQVYRYDDRDDTMSNSIFIRLDMQVVYGRTL